MTTTEKLDLYKQHKDEYVAPKRPQLVRVKPASYLAIDGRGQPGSDNFQEKIGALYAVAYTLKFTSKEAGRDYGVCKLEGLYWPARKCKDPCSIPPDQLRWKLLIRVPTFIKDRQLQAAVKVLLDKGKAREVSAVTLERLDEGRCVQMLHVGPYDQTRPTVEAMQEFAREQGLKLAGRHHEIYLSDPRRVAPEKLRTILRHPVG